ncbi:hypothetical protein ATY41_12185 [Leifsonia xyli subsp. xyli]|uniref:Histidine kinase n=1 Tax=Leifsonia xyli subsp. xyli TaxID=59736 RepID=A0A1E2SJB6_LEIXY|nr:hypothetical protein [Leifsonia xyli]ODA89837.1 hypothetical protein ATY41_12185 [Leifsonia xyli subsp. xyli]
MTNSSDPQRADTTALARMISAMRQDATGARTVEEKLKDLLVASQVLTASLDLADVLHQVVETAVRLVGARYGALGVIGPDGALRDFLHVGMSEVQVRAIGHP